jgi:hypothetical protein
MREARVEIRGIQEVQAAIREYKGDITRSLNLIINRAALDSVSDVKKNMERGGKSGVVYYRIPGDKYMTIRAGGEDGPPVAFVTGGGKQNLSLTHRASAPGESPAKDTGGLITSIYNEDRPKRNGFLKVIGSRLKYAYYLEFGTRKIEPRPSWIPAVERAIPKMLTDVRIAIAAAKARAEKTTK